jgi:hypothetical protein
MGFTVANWVYLAMPRLINKITTTIMIYYKTDHHKSRECMKRVVSPTYKPYTKYLIGNKTFLMKNYKQVEKKIY